MWRRASKAPCALKLRPCHRLQWLRQQTRSGTGVRGEIGCRANTGECRECMQWHQEILQDSVQEKHTHMCTVDGSSCCVDSMSGSIFKQLQQRTLLQICACAAIFSGADCCLATQVSSRRPILLTDFASDMFRVASSLESIRKGSTMTLASWQRFFSSGSQSACAAAGWRSIMINGMKWRGLDAEVDGLVETSGAGFLCAIQDLEGVCANLHGMNSNCIRCYLLLGFHTYSLPQWHST